MPLFRKQSAAVLPSLAPHGVRRGCNRCRIAGIHGEAMYTALTLRSACSSSSCKPAMSGVEGPSPRLSLGDSKGVFSSEREYPLWCCGAHAAFSLRALRGKQPLPEGAQKRSSPFGLLLFYFSQMTGFWRSDSTKALAFSTASARGSFTCSPVRMSLQDTTPAVISSSPRK